jgi:phosphatidylglycerophosphate synthase
MAKESGVGAAGETGDLRGGRVRPATAWPACSGLAGVFAFALAARAWLDLHAAYPLEASAVFAAGMAVVVIRLDGHHPHPRFGAANAVTTIRLMLTCLLAGLVWQRASAEAAWFAVALATPVALLDGVDGWLARRHRVGSAFGARFDMETDAFFILVLSVLAWRHGKAGGWVLLSGLMRYAFVAAAGLLPWLARPLYPSIRRKAIAVLQFIGLIVAVAPIVARPLSAAVAAAALAALTWSFAVDVAWLWRRRR